MEVKNKINVVSLFDGMSCFQLALNRLGIIPDKYFASEVDKYAIQVTMANFPDTIQLGDVRNVKGSDLGFVHILAGGSPCQSFSFAGKRKGMSTKCELEILSLSHYLDLKKQNFEFEGQSYLFWEYMRILEEVRVVNPNVKFILENVLMGEKWQKILTKAIGINPIMINSALLSAQNRKRLYWTNIGSEQVGFFGDLECTIAQPKDKGILLKDVLETDVAGKYFLSEKALKFVLDEARLKKKYTQNGSDNEKSLPHLANNQTNWCGDFIVVHNTMPRSSKSGKGGTGPLSRNDGKTYCLDTGNTNAIEIQCVAMRGRNSESQKIRVAGLPTEQQLEPRNDGKTNCLTSVQKDNLVQIGNIYDNKHNSVAGRVYTSDGKSVTLSALGGGGGAKTGLYMMDGSDEYMDSVSKIAKIQGNIRRLTPTECERLQTVPDGYSNHVSDSQRYKMLGNGWTIDVISYILSHLPMSF